MAPAFLERLMREKPKCPEGHISKLIVALAILDVDAVAAKEKERDQERFEVIPKHLKALRDLILGTEEHAATKETVLHIIHEICQTELLLLLVKHLIWFNFETRKDAAAVFCSVLRIHDDEGNSPGVNYVSQRPGILELLFHGYDNSQLGIHTGAMLRECIRAESLAKLILDSHLFMMLFTKVEAQNFDIAADAFSAFKDLLTRHKELVRCFLVENYTKFFGSYMELLKCQNYVTRRLSLKLLGDLLSESCNVEVTKLFVMDAKHLMTMMVLLRDDSQLIQLEAFYIFKVFLCYPVKSPAVLQILLQNQDKLLQFFRDFQEDRAYEDERFEEDKELVTKEIQALGQQKTHQAPGVSKSEQHSDLHLCTVAENRHQI